jgi:putative ABC transport system substrate-binding protein
MWGVGCNSTNKIVADSPPAATRLPRRRSASSRHAVPTIYPLRKFVAAESLMSYGSSITETYRQKGIFVGQMLKREKPSDLPVQESTKVELVLNLRTAKALDVLMRIDEVIE